VPTSRFAVSSPDSDAFARLSGDFNPLHIDPTRARRLIFGAAVPHGVHVLLGALDATFARLEHPLSMQSLRVAFLAPAKHVEPLTTRVSEAERGVVLITVLQDDLPLQNITLKASAADALDGVDIPDSSPPRGEPLNLALPDLADRS